MPPADAPARRRILSFDVGVRHLAYVDLTAGPAGSDAYEVHRWEVVDVEAEGGGRDAEALLSVLDARFFDPPGGPCYDEVLIENQPAFKNPVMKTAQVTLSTYFHMLRLHAGTVGRVRLIGASRKLGARHRPPPPPPTQEDARPATRAPPPAAAAAAAAYRTRKDESVRAATHYLAHVVRDPARLEQLRASKKRDDLSDCLMQAIVFAERGAKDRRPG